MMYIVRAIPGSCGDRVSAVIDNKSSLLFSDGSIRFGNDRMILKNLEIDIASLPELLEKASLTYKSLSSQHYIESVMMYDRYTYIAITVETDDMFQWCIDRLGKIYSKVTFNNDELRRGLTFHSINSFYKISVADIIKGNLIDRLDEYKIPYVAPDLYQRWLAVNTNKYPYNF